MEIPVGRGFQRHIGDSAVFRQPVPWKVSREKVSSILVEAKKERKIRTHLVLATVEVTGVFLGVTPLLINGRG